MKRISIILNTIYPVIVLIVLLGLLTQTAGIYLQFFTETLDGAALPVLTVFFHQWKQIEINPAELSDFLSIDFSISAKTNERK